MLVVFPLKDRYTELDFKELFKMDNYSGFIDADDVKLDNSPSIALSSEYKLTGSRGKHLKLRTFSIRSCCMLNIQSNYK